MLEQERPVPGVNQHFIEFDSSKFKISIILSLSSYIHTYIHTYIHKYIVLFDMQVLLIGSMYLMWTCLHTYNDLIIKENAKSYSDYLC